MAITEVTKRAAPTGRAVQIFLAAVIGAAFVGFVVGIRQGKTVGVRAAAGSTEVSAATSPNVASVGLPALSYREFDRRMHGPNNQWRSHLDDLEQPVISVLDKVTLDESGKSKALDARAKRRAFDGAPPVVPHPIDQLTTASCRACHESGLYIGITYAPQMSHPFMHNCTQCHVEQQSSEFAAIPVAANKFRGLSAPQSGARAWPGAPPVIPHSTFMRENCVGCHGPHGPDAIRTTHPWRLTCLQCHAPSALLDRTMVEGDTQFLPGPDTEQP